MIDERQRNLPEAEISVHPAQNREERGALIHVLDLNYGVPRTTAAFLVETDEGPILIETGPDSTYGTLVGRLEELGYASEDVRHVLVTHIHLDHAGSAWRFAEQGATVYVHALGAKHLRDPSRLLASAGRIFGSRTEELWGKPGPVVAGRMRVVENGEVLRLGKVNVEALETPGHADHHLTWRIEDTIFAGDAGGVRIGNGPIFAPTPPPEIRVETWQASIARLRSLRAREIYVSHFGRFTDVEEHLARLENCLLGWASWIKTRMEKNEPHEDLVSEFSNYVTTELVQTGLSPNELREYEIADPAWMNARGLIRFWQKRAEYLELTEDRR